jgi:hypothetical protein
MGEWEVGEWGEGSGETGKLAERAEVTNPALKATGLA